MNLKRRIREEDERKKRELEAARIEAERIFRESIVRRELIWEGSKFFWRVQEHFDVHIFEDLDQPIFILVAYSTEHEKEWHIYIDRRSLFILMKRLIETHVFFNIFLIFIYIFAFNNSFFLFELPIK